MATGIEKHDQRDVRDEVRQRRKALIDKVQDMTKLGVAKGMDGGTAKRQAEVEAIGWYVRTYGRKPDTEDLQSIGVLK